MGLGRIKVQSALTWMLVVICAVSLLLAGCSSKGNTAVGTAAPTATADRGEAASAAETDKPKEPKEPVTLKMFVDQQAWEKAGGFWGKNDVSKWFLDQTGVNIEFTFATDANHTNINMMVASDSMPDLLFIPSPNGFPLTKKLADEGKVWDLKELSEKYAPDFMANVPENVRISKNVEFQTKDHFYQIPQGYLPAERFNEPEVFKSAVTPVVRKDIYEAIGSPSIKTDEDYLHMLRTVKDKYPDMTPAMAGRYVQIFGMKTMVIQLLGGYAGIEAVYQDGDQYRYSLMDPKAGNMLKFLSTLHSEKLVPATVLTDKMDQAVAKIYSGNVFSVLWEEADNLDTYNAETGKNQPGAEWMAIEPFSVGGAAPGFPGIGAGTGGMGILVSKSTKYPEQAIKFLELLFSDEGQKAIMFGVAEGVTYDVKDGKPVLKPEIHEQMLNEADAVFSSSGVGAFFFLRDDYWSRVRYFPYYSATVRDGLVLANKYYKDMSRYDGAVNFPADSEETKILAKISELAENEYAKIILGKPEDALANFNKFVETAKSLGSDKVDALITQNVNNKAQLIETYK